ncbi:unnamed protein product [Phytophthora fragariaefolia]|uniref:Unnamed protein product n=1 Tax=Phytophthora fragariaefolia TaxID=1490495 RepID=A0A9W7D1H8_9STRA|nr:unnamed protein product [Phytophthora fragariaefolia]
MKRRAGARTSNNDARHRDITSKLSGNAKKLSKKREVKSAAASILGVKKRIDATSEGSTSWRSGDGSSLNYVAECQRLRGQLERVLLDHQRQEEEIVALRALAKSLKEEVETIQERQQLQRSACSSSNYIAVGNVQQLGSHQFFKMDVQVEKLEGENSELRRQLEDSQEGLQRARDCIAEKLPVYKLAAVKANAELRCVKSQLQQERAHSDHLQNELVKCKARQDDVFVRVSSERGNNQEEHDNDTDEGEIVKREREAFFRQCMHLQDRSISSRYDIKQTNATARGSDGVGPSVETKTAQLADFGSTINVIASAKSCSDVKTVRHPDENLIGLDFYLGEMNLAPSKFSKSI